MLDTNVWLDWLVFGDASVTPIKAAVQAQRAQVFISSACEDELKRVLGYTLSGRTLTADQQTSALAQCRAMAVLVDPNTEAHAIETLPRCADPDDQKFLELARDCRADLLITKDGDLLALATHKVRALPFLIVNPRETKILLM